MILNEFNKLVAIVRNKGMIYFKDNITELKAFVNKLSELKSINSIVGAKTLYYTLLELLELIQEEDNVENLDYEIKQLENRFLDYVEVGRESL